MSKRFILLAAAAMLLVPRYAPAQEEAKKDVATLPRRCGICHLERVESTGGSFNFLTIRTPDSAGEKGMCYSCHNGIVKDSRRSIWTGRQHRADGHEAKAAPGEKASCGTCHDPHLQDAEVATFMRYREGTFTHCVTCHGGDVMAGHPVSAQSGGSTPDCGSCHRVHRATGKALIKASNLGNLCSSCHGENPSRKEQGPGQGTHPVGGRGPTCDTCHSVHSRRGKGLVIASVKSGRLCQSCHKSHVSERSRRGNHPVVDGKVTCLACHRSHNGASYRSKPALLAEGPEKFDSLCQACHPALTMGEEVWNHPVGRPLEDVDEGKIKKLQSYGGLLGPDKTVQCLSCHKSHGAFRGTAALVVKSQALCLYCHAAQNSLAPNKARFGTHPISVRPDRASIAPDLLKAGGETGPAGELVCTTCHRTHSGKPGTAGLILSKKDYSCSICHTAEAEVADTPHRAASEGGDPCLDCHDNHGWAIPLDTVQMGGSVVEKVCWSCHGAEGSAPMSGYFGHIVGVPPSSSIFGRELPLFWADGRRLKSGIITCATCHDPHRNPAEHFLRITPEETRSELCSACHRDKNAVKETKHDISLYFPKEKNRRGESAADTGPCGACHIIHSGGPGESWAREVSVLPGDPGELAVFCSNCHSEGAFAQGKIVAEKGHPPVEVLDERPDVQVVDCNGCHNPHVWNPIDQDDKGDFFVAGDGANSFLNKPADERSLLCLGCHREKESVRGSKHDLADTGAADGGGACRNCHVPHGGEKLLMWAYPLTDAEDFGTGTCLSCHGPKGVAPTKALEGFSHPVGVNPGPDTGQDLPRYRPSGRKYFRGMVACSTCHDPHNWSPISAEGVSVPDEASTKTSFLRLPADGFSPLCFPCHANRSLVVGTDHDLRLTAAESVNLDGITPDESGTCGACHKMHGAPQRNALWNRETGSGMDPWSTYCRSCHDADRMKEATVPARPETHLVDYPGKGLVSRPFMKRPSSFFSTSSTFELYGEKGEKDSQGFLSCVTCHDAHRWEPDTTRSGTGTAQDGNLKNSFLKVRNTFSVGKSFCKECHGEDALEHYQQYHTVPAAAGEEKK